MKILDEVVLMTPPGATGSRRHRFCTVEHEGETYWVDLTVTRKLRSIDSAKLYKMENGRLIFAKLIRVSIVRELGAV